MRPGCRLMVPEEEEEEEEKEKLGGCGELRPRGVWLLKFTYETEWEEEE